jgi:hypothetical protein
MAEMKVWYDLEGAYLEVVFEDAPATMVEIREDVFERRTPGTNGSGFSPPGVEPEQRSGSARRALFTS